MASISSTSSLGNTALRGFGGMASGIDRDSIIEKMTLGTTTKINNQKKKITELQWKQEAYRGVSDKIIDWADTYASYTSSKNLKDLNVFAKNQISLRGAETATRFVTATGSSSMVNNISIKGVQQLATSAVLKSESHSSQGGAGIATEVDDLLSKDVRTSNLKGAKLDFAIYDSDGKKTSSATFTFASTYTVQVDGKDVTKNIDYTLETQSLDDLVNILNEHVLGKSEAKVGDANLKDVFEFGNDNGQIVLKKKSGAPEGVVMEGDYALKTLGLDDSQKNEKGKVEFGADGTITMQNKFEDTAINERKMVDYLTGQKMTFNYDGSSKSIELITKEEAAALKGMSESDAKEQMAKNLQNRLNQAFGTGTVKVKFDDVLSFDTEKAGSTVSVMSNNYEMLNNMGLTYGASNKVNLNGKLDQSALSNAFASAGITIPKGDEALNLKINGVEIKGLTGNSSINDILSKINSTTEAGVKATYVESTGEFMLVSSETGAGRQIKLEGEVTNALFGNKQGDGYYVQPLLKRVWAVQLDILKGIDTICRRHNIRYFGWFGTLLGAVRHHGYIPWDDDMDLAMVREDYERFRYYAKTELPMGWVVSEEYPTWICILNTNKFQLDQKFLDRFHGCPFITGVDIFCIDHTPQSIEDEELHINMFQAVNSLCLNWNLPEDDAQWNGVSKWSYLAEIEELTSCPIDRQRPVKAQLYFLADRIAAMYWEDGSHEMTRLTRFSKDRHYRIPASCFEKIIEIPFEHTMLPVLEDYDLICRLDFGENYMTPIRIGDHEYLKKQISALKKIYETEGKIFPECFNMTFE